jgi:PAS domain S-box-containing protein
VDERKGPLSEAELMKANADLRAGIDQLRRDHAELKEASALLTKTFESISEAVVVFDPAKLIILSCNPAATSVFGYGAKEMIGRPVSMLHVSPAAFEAFISALREALASQQTAFSYACSMRRKDGTLLTTDQTVTALQNGGGPSGFVSVMRDITDRLAAEEAERESEELLKAVTDDLPAVVAYVGPDWRYRFVNRVFENWRGKSRGEILGKTVMEVLGERGWLQVKPHLDAALSGQTVSYEDVFTYPDGAERVLFIQYIPRFSDVENGEVQGVCALMTDITRQKRNEAEIIKYKDHLELLVELRTEELEKLNDRLKEEIAGHEISQEKIKSLNTELGGHLRKLEEVNRELEAFSYSLAHDLSSPLRVIDGFAKLLEMHYMEKIEGEGKEFIKTIRENTQKMGRFISDLLHLSRLGKSEISKACVDIEGIARILTAEFMNQNSGRDIRFVLNALPAAYGERTLLRQALFNLLANAVKFTGTRERAVIEIGGLTKENETVYYVRDNGVGFDMKHAGRLFGLFKRLHAESEFAGTGAGLAIVGRIIERHGGRVWAEGKIDEGAAFWFALPASTPAP